LGGINYYPFGMGMSGRTFAAENAYRYGFNGQEKSTELDPSGNSMTAEFWQYDSRIGRRWNIDPVIKKHESPYAAFANNPVWLIDVNGADTIPASLARKQYDASSWWSPLTKLIPGTGIVEHSHADDINIIYKNTGGDAKFNSQSGTITHMNASLTSVTPGLILLTPNSQAITNTTSAFNSASESGSEKAWINLMLGGMIKGTIPENIIFSENGTVSNYLRGSATLNKAVRDWYKAGQSSEPFGINYGAPEQINDAVNNLSVFSIGNFIGSARAQITYSEKDDVLRVTITNVTSVHSGDYHKHFYWHDEEAPFLIRNPKETKPQPYTNFSQTYQLKFSYKSIMQQLGTEWRLIE
jgi:RHS repeat-associated protein